MKDTTYTFGDYLYDQWITVAYCYPARYAVIPTIRVAAAIANAARRIRCHRLARRMAWYAWDVADCTPTGREFGLLPSLMPWAYGEGDWRYHCSAYGDYGRDLPRDLNGYVHLTAAGWLAAPMDTAGEPMTEEQAEELAEQAQAATREAEAGIAAWRRRR